MLKPAFSLEAGIVLLSMALPSSGYILLKKHARGILMIAWMMVMGFITYQLTDESISFYMKHSPGERERKGIAYPWFWVLFQ